MRKVMTVRSSVLVFVSTLPTSHSLRSVRASDERAILDASDLCAA
jgi:hypothetical protein